MTPQEKLEFERMKTELATLKSLFYKGDFPDKKVYYKKLSANGGLEFGNSNITLGSSATITTPSGGGGGSSDAVDISARTAIGQMKTIIQTLLLSA